MVSRTLVIVINGGLLIFAVAGLFFASVEISGYSPGGRISTLERRGIVDLTKAAEDRPEWDDVFASTQIGNWVSAHHRAALAIVSALALVAAVCNLFLLRSGTGGK